MVIKINYTSSDVYVSTSVSPVYVVVNYSGVGGTTNAVWGAITGTLSDQTDLQSALDAKVPYTGATANVDLGEYELKAGQVEFDQTPTGTAGVGVMRWNDTDGTLDLGLKGGNVTLQVGQEQVQRVVNKSGANLLESAYQVVKVINAQGQRLAVDLAQGNNDLNSADTLGIVTENISNNQEGFITTSGLVRGINTTGSLQGETWADGDVLYLSPTTAGAITKVKPTAPQHSVILGYVVYAHANNGKIFVKVDNGYELGELHDCYLPTPSNNDGIFWNTANSRYQNNSITGVLGYTPVPTTRTLTINGTAYDLSADRSWTVSGTNIYTADGTLTGNRVVTNNTYTLTIRNTSASAALILQNTQAYGTGGVYTQYAQQWLSSTGTSAGYVLGDIGRLVMTSMVQAPQFFVGSLAGIIDAGVSRGGSIGINGAPIDFGTATNAGGGTNIGRWFSTGNLLIQTGGTFTDAGYKLDVKGTALIDGFKIGGTYGTFSSLFTNSTLGAILQGNSAATTFSITLFGNSGASGLFVDNQGRVKIGVYDSTYNSSAILEAVSTTRGFLMPRMTTTQRDAIATPATGLQIYNTTTNENNTYNGTAWVAAGGSNIYTADGTLTGNRTVNLAGYNLAFKNAASTYGIYFSADSSIPRIDFLANGSFIGQISNTTTDVRIANNLLSTGGIIFDTQIVSGTTSTRMKLTNAGRLLLGTTTESTYLLDVNGTARVSGQTTISAATSGTSGYSLVVTDTNGSNGANIFLQFSTSTALFLRSGSTGARIASTNSKDFLGFNFTSGNVVVGGNESGYNSDKLNVVGINSGTTDGVGITLEDNGGSTSVGAGINYRAGAKACGAIRWTINSGYNNTGLRFFVNNNAGTLTEAFRVTETQNVLVGSTTNIPSAILAADSTTKGFRPPVMTNAQRSAISSPAVGLIVYCTDATEGLYVYKSTGWTFVI